MSFVTYKQLIEAEGQFRHYAMQLPHSQRPLFGAYVGLTVPNGWHHNSHTWKVTNDELRRVELMLGPHSYTVFKMYVAKLLQGTE